MSPEAYLERPASTPTPHPRGYAHGLSPEMLRQAAARLSIIAFVYAGTYFAAYGLGRFVPRTHEHFHLFGILDLGDLIAAGFIVSSVALGFLVRRKDLDPQLLLDLGLVYMVFGAMGIDVGILLYPIPDEPAGISWTCVWIVSFPVIVPATPGKTFLASLAAASVGPLFYLVALSAGMEVPGWGSVFQWFMASYICVAIAMVASRTVYKMRSEISRARRMGAYRLVEQLGKGGMGEVWRAEHRMLARPAAVKLIRPEALGGQDARGRRELVTRFNREAQATAMLSSPHTVQLYDFGVTDEGVFYYVMELLRGLDLDTLVKKHGPLSAGRVVSVLVQVCDSLSEAHQQGVIHRDVKPANVYLCRLGSRLDVAKLLDFGLVKASDGALDDTQVTLPDTTAGTPAYMAPEMVSGKSPVDARSDLYSLGCVGYWLLTGQNVFIEGTPMQVAFAHVNATPDPPSTRTELEIPADLEQAILRCLEKDPAGRPQTADALRETLAATECSGTWDRRRAADWWEAHLPDLVQSRTGFAAKEAAGS